MRANDSSCNMTDEFNDYDANDLDKIDEYADYFAEYEDECVAARGTSQCDGLCLPQCNWCLVSHSCPDDCLGGPCPYESLDPGMVGERDRALGFLDAVDGTKRERLTQGVSRRHYLRGFESWIRRKDPRRCAKKAAKRKREIDWSMVF